MKTDKKVKIGKSNLSTLLRGQQVALLFCVIQKAAWQAEYTQVETRRSEFRPIQFSYLVLNPQLEEYSSHCELSKAMNLQC